MKRIALVVAVLLAACGTEKAPQSAGGPADPTNPDTGMGGAIPIASYLGTPATAKVVLKTARPFYTPLTQADPNDPEGSLPIACVGTDTSTCPAVTNVACVNSQCAQISYRLSPFYVRDFAVAPDSFLVPCDGGVYVAEIYGATAPAVADGPRFVTERHVSSEFTMSSTCAATGLSWASAAAGSASTLLPGFSFPPIYVGMGPGFETFTVSTQRVAYPWSGAGWTVSYVAAGSTVVVAPTATTASTATFASPTSTAALDFSGTFNLDRTILVATGTTTPGAWIVNVGPITQSPVGAGPILVP